MTAPLASLKILDFTTLLPGPFATMILADLGAEVVRIESPSRPDMVRFMPPFDGSTSAWHSVLNRSKRSLALDLKRPSAIAVVKRMVQSYDIVLEQFRPGVMDRLGVGYEALKAENPRLIYGAITGYGQTGPLKDRAGHDNNYLALAGMMSHSGRQASGPTPLGVQIADVGGGSFGAVIGLLTAVIHRAVTGQGQMVDISMFDLAVAWQTHLMSQYLVGQEVAGYENQPLNGGSFYDYYATSDGRYLSVGSLEPKFWEGFCTAIGRPEFIPAGLGQSPESQQALKTELRAIIEQRPLAEWTSLFATLDVCVEPVLTLPETLAHPQTQARQLVVQVGHQSQIASPFKFSATQPTYKHIGAALGEHTTAVLAECGYTPAEITALQADGALG